MIKKSIFLIMTLSFIGIISFNTSLYSVFGGKTDGGSGGGITSETDPIFISSAPATYVNKTGDTITGNIDINGNSIYNALWGYGQGEYLNLVPEKTTLLVYFNEGTGTTSYDYSGNYSTAVFVGNVSWVDGKFNKAVKITDSNAYINFGNCSSISHSSITISMWVRQDSALGTATILAKNLDSNNKSWWIGVNANRQFWFTHSTDGTNSSYSTDSVSNSGISLGHWTMITVTYDGVKKRLYLDNYLDKEYNETTYAGSFYKVAGSSVIAGRLYPTGTETWQGYIDCIKISSYVWTPEEVKKAYFSGDRPYSIANNLYIKYPGEIVFESSTAVKGGDLAADKGTMSIKQWADTILFKGNNVSVRAPYNKQRDIDPTKNLVAVNVGVLSRAENGVTGEGGGVDLRWIPTGETTGRPAITWTTSDYLALQGNTQVTGTLLVGNNIIAQSSTTCSAIYVSTITMTGQIKLGNYTVTQIRNLIPVNTGAIVYCTDDNDIYVSTGTVVGSWKNSRTNLAP